MKYTAKMKHNAETITKLVVMQYNTFQFSKKVIRIILAMILIVYGFVFLNGGMVTPILALFLGCMLIAGLNVRPKHNANLILKQMNGKYPSSEYYFSDTGFKDSLKSEEIPYYKLIRLIDDKKYLYLYVTSESAYMVNSATVQGLDGLNGLKSLISEKAKLKWSKPTTLLNFSINSMRSGRIPGEEDEVYSPLLNKNRFWKR